MRVVASAMFVPVIVSLPLSVWPMASLAQQKAPVPDAQAEQTAKTSAGELFGSRFRQAKTTAEKTALAAEMIEAAGKLQEGTPGQYVLLKIAADVAAGAGDGPTALQAIEKLVQRFDVAGPKLTAETLLTAARSATVTNQYKAIGEAALKVVDAVAETDEYELALSLCELARSSAQKTRQYALTKELAAKMDDLKKRQTAFQEYRAAWVVLDKNPTEPAANLAAGRYLCFVKGDWDRGVPMLALGSDAKLKDVAVKDLRGANSAEEQAAIGDAWWELAETQQGSERDLLRLRAGFWYQQAEPKLAGELAGLKIKQRLAELKKGDRDIPTVASKATPPSAALPREQLLAGTILIMTFEPDTFTSRDGKIYVTDLSSCENHGVLEGPAQTPMGRAGASLQLGGRGCVLLPTLRGRLTQELKQLSLSLWVLQSDLTGSQIVFDVGFSGSRSISLVCHDSEFEFILPDHYGGKALRVLGRGVPGQWRHVVGVWNGGEQRVYVDGVVRAVSATQGLTLNARSISEETARLGAQAKPDHRSERYFRGAIDEVAVFDRALSEEEIQTLIQLGKRGEPLVKAVRSRAGR